MSPLEAREVRSKIIDLILATDARTHFEFLSRFRTIRGSDQFNYIKNEDDRWLTAELCIRSSDIGHCALSWPQHFEWTGLAIIELYLQGDEELRLGRTISPLCDRQSHAQLAKSQIGFLQHVVRPLFVELDSIGKQQKTIADALKNLDDNCDRWEKLGDAVELIVFPRPVRDFEAAMNGASHHLDVSLLTRKDGLTCNNPIVKKPSWQVGGEASAQIEAGDASLLTADAFVKAHQPPSNPNVSDSHVSLKQVPSDEGDARELASGIVERQPDDKNSGDSHLPCGGFNLPTSSESSSPVAGSGESPRFRLVLESPPAEDTSQQAHSAAANAAVLPFVAVNSDSQAREQAAAETLESPPPSLRSHVSTDSAQGVPVPALDKTFFGF
ncbi:hypothetical protein ACSSS7_003719 [Eimeria intestinalis]